MVSATEKAEIFKELHAILKAEEGRGRKLLTEELASLQLDFILSESKVWECPAQWHEVRGVPGGSCDVVFGAGGKGP